jgi:hypothetical protein
LPNNAVEFRDAFALPIMLKQVEFGFNKARRFDLLNDGGLVAVRVSSAVAKDITAKALALREELEAANETGGGIRFSLFTSVYAEETEEAS